MNGVVSSFHEIKKALQAFFTSSPSSENVQSFLLPHKRKTSHNGNTKSSSVVEDSAMELRHCKKRKLASNASDNSVQMQQTGLIDDTPLVLKMASVADLQRQLQLYQHYTKEIEALLSQTATIETPLPEHSQPSVPQSQSDSLPSNSNEWFVSAKRRQENFPMSRNEMNGNSSVVTNKVKDRNGPQNQMQHKRTEQICSEQQSSGTNALVEMEGNTDSSDLSAVFNTLIGIDQESNIQTDNKKEMKIKCQNLKSETIDTFLEKRTSSHSVTQRTITQQQIELLSEKEKTRKHKNKSVFNNGDNVTHRNSPVSTNNTSNQSIKGCQISPKSKNSKFVLLGTSLSTESTENLNQAVNSLGGTILKHYNSSVTHIITDYNILIKHQSNLSTNNNNQEGKDVTLKTVRRTIKFLFGILEGKWILTSDWIKQSIAEGQWIQEEPYEVDGDAHGNIGGPRKGRIAASQQSAPLFHATKFLLHGEFTTPTRTELKKLIVYGGGEVLKGTADLKTASKETELSMLGENTQFVVICDAQLPTERVRKVAEMFGIEPVKTSWILDSISCFEILPLQNYQFRK